MEDRTTAVNQAAGKDNGQHFSKATEIIAWVLLGIGFILFALYVSDFRDSNLGLMVAIGFVIAGMQVYGIGTFVHLLSNKTSKSD
ncbi:hypothetical protein [Paenibacillus gansuensis]|uniref:Uncharacterized protein n=1 Tax=Paenibacillus gansuensis TaxID=306542 RepID=A0ABW5PLP5_9BACL